MFLGFPDPDPLVGSTDPDYRQAEIIKKTVIPAVL
jgi:hypothetical protein